MTETGGLHATRVVPLMRYRDLPKAISWLSEAFGFEPHYTASDEDGKLIYAQMIYGNGMVMLGPVRDSDFDDLLSQPDEIGGTETQSCYLVVADIEAHYTRAKEAGAEIALDVQSDETGGRAYSCRDCEGHLWNFGTFNPWQSTGSGVTPLGPAANRIKAGPISMARSAAAVFAGLAIAGVAIGIYTSHQQPTDRISNIRIVDPDTAANPPTVGLPTAPVRVVSALRKKLQQERSARREAEQRLATVRRDLAMARAKTHDVDAATRRMTDEINIARGAEQAALATVERLRAQHLKEQRIAAASIEELQNLIESEREAKEKAVKAAEDIKYELVLERQLRQQAERNAKTAEKDARVAKRNIKSNTTPPPAPSNVKINADSAKKVKTESDNKKKVTAVEPKGAADSGAADKAASDTAPATAAKKEADKKPVRRKVVRKTYKKKKPPAAKKRRSNGIAKGWPYDTW